MPFSTRVYDADRRKLYQRNTLGDSPFAAANKHHKTFDLQLLQTLLFRYVPVVSTSSRVMKCFVSCREYHGRSLECVQCAGNGTWEPLSRCLCHEQLVSPWRRPSKGSRPEEGSERDSLHVLRNGRHACPFEWILHSRNRVLPLTLTIGSIGSTLVTHTTLADSSIVLSLLLTDVHHGPNQADSSQIDRRQGASQAARDQR